MQRPDVFAACLLFAAAPALAAPVYTASGDLIPPKDYREWVFLSSGLDMNYSSASGKTDPMGQVFDNVFVDPASWAAFKTSGRWPDKTVMVKESRVAGGQASINQAGHFQTEQVMGTELHVLDRARFNGGWGFFASAKGEPARLIPHAASCYSCHQQHGAEFPEFPA